MNLIVREYFNLLDMTVALRHQMFEIITDADLAYRLPGDNPSFGDLCFEMGNTQMAYIDSFKTHTYNDTLRHDDPTLASSVERLKPWFNDLDEQIKAVLSTFSDDELHSILIDRVTMQWPVMVNFHTYREALLIFFAKASVYLKALQKPLPDQWRDWMG